VRLRAEERGVNAVKARAKLLQSVLANHHASRAGGLRGLSVSCRLLTGGQGAANGQTDGAFPSPRLGNYDGHA